jgi:hypothetical protein
MSLHVDGGRCGGDARVMPRVRWSVSCLAVLVALAGCGGEQETSREGHARMVALLAEEAGRAEQDSQYFGQSTLRELSAELARQGEAAGWRLRYEVAARELQAGNERRAIEVLTGARQALIDGRIEGDVAANVAINFHLGVAWLRLGETENCCAEPVPESCILPIAGGGLHGVPEGSQRAVESFGEVLQNVAPHDYWHYATLWLFNVAHMTLGTWPDAVPQRYRLPPKAFAPGQSFPRFPNVAGAVGLDTNGTAGGAIVDDFDGDEYLDVVVSEWAPRGQLRFFHNAGDGTFVDRTKEAGIVGITGGLHVVHADWDNDGDLDLLVLRGGWWVEHGKLPCSLLQNDGAGRFTDVTFAVGLGERRLPTQTAAFADFDLDGDLDLYIGSESSDRVPCASQLYRNDGGRFVDVAASAGVENRRYAKGVAWGDYDGDRWPDLYVSNIGGDNRLYHNRGDGTFEDVAAAAGVTGPANSFPTWFFDFDNDGALDIWVGNYDTGAAHVASFLLGGALRFDTMKLYRGDGKGLFTDVAQRWGLTYPAMPMGCNFGDLDNDGWLDFYLGTGDPQYANLVPNLMYHNRGGQGFEDVTMAGGFGHLQKGHGVAFADLDNDGDQDVFETMGGAYPGDTFRNVLFENPGSGNRWLALRLVGTESARCAIGASIRATVREGGELRVIRRDVSSGGSFGGNPLRQTLGLGAAEALERLEVFWPKTGRTQVVEGASLDGAFRIVEGQAGCTPIGLRPAPFRRR